MKDNLPETQDVATKKNWQVGQAVCWDCEKWFIHRFLSPYTVEIELADWPVPVREVVSFQLLQKWGGA